MQCILVFGGMSLSQSHYLKIRLETRIGYMNFDFLKDFFRKFDHDTVKLPFMHPSHRREQPTIIKLMLSSTQQTKPNQSLIQFDLIFYK